MSVTCIDVAESRCCRYRTEPRKPYAPLNLTAGETLVADKRVSITIHWLPPLESDLPITRFKASGFGHSYKV